MSSLRPKASKARPQEKARPRENKLRPVIFSGTTDTMYILYRGGYAVGEITACPLPTTRRSATMEESVRVLRSFSATYWWRAFLIAAGAALIIGLPTRLIPNPLFVRMVPTTTIDYVVFVTSAILIGLTWAVPTVAAIEKGTERRSIFGGLGAFLAVGCPTCNKLVLLLLGSGGALTYFAPIQPFLGAGAVVLLVVALRRRLGRFVG